ncbi:hypothetical protein F4809DRAFT_655364 [Biscogniauxia mediterranea]|nr:hypothetical protein F4809DRAFT_655364 [Biscogniauxia mediterranea]
MPSACFVNINNNPNYVRGSMITIEIDITLDANVEMESIQGWWNIVEDNLERQKGHLVLNKANKDCTLVENVELQDEGDFIFVVRVLGKGGVELFNTFPTLLLSSMPLQFYKKALDVDGKATIEFPGRTSILKKGESFKITVRVQNYRSRYPKSKIEEINLAIVDDEFGKMVLHQNWVATGDKTKHTFTISSQFAGTFYLRATVFGIGDDGAGQVKIAEDISNFAITITTE